MCVRGWCAGAIDFGVWDVRECGSTMCLDAIVATMPIACILFKKRLTRITRFLWAGARASRGEGVWSSSRCDRFLGS
jgi:hypothetical protein